MADQSLLAEAWHRTELLGPKKIFSTVGAGLVTLAWNFKVGLRSWQLTEWFAVCVIVAWLTLVALEFGGYLAVGWMRVTWTLFLQRLRLDIAHEVAQVVVEQTRVHPPTVARNTFSSAQLDAVSAGLAGKAAQEILITTRMGEPDAYRNGQSLADIFKKHGWKVDGGFVENDMYGVCLLVRDRLSMSKTTLFVNHLLVSSGIRLSLVSAPAMVIDPAGCILFIGSNM